MQAPTRNDPSDGLGDSGAEKAKLREREQKRAYSRFEQGIKAEHELVAKRMTWLLTSQGLLFTAFGVVGFQASTGQTTRHDVLNIIAAVGLTLAAIVEIGICAAVATANDYRTRLNRLELSAEFYPQVGRSALLPLTGKIISLAVPLVFVLAWMGIHRSMQRGSDAPPEKSVAQPSSCASIRVQGAKIELE